MLATSLIAVPQFGQAVRGTAPPTGSCGTGRSATTVTTSADADADPAQALPARSGPGGGLGAHAGRGRHPVEDDGHQHDRQAGVERRPDVQALQRLLDVRPSPWAPISEAMTTMDSAAMMVWLMPMTMVRLAIGSSTVRSRWNRVDPERVDGLAGGRPAPAGCRAR